LAATTINRCGFTERQVTNTLINTNIEVGQPINTLLYNRYEEVLKLRRKILAMPSAKSVRADRRASK
jgi:hypothetical protein